MGVNFQIEEIVGTLKGENINHMRRAPIVIVPRARFTIGRLKFVSEFLIASIGIEFFGVKAK